MLYGTSTSVNVASDVPENSTTVMALSIYKNFKEQGLFGYATAQGIVLFVITLVLAAFTLRATRKEQIEL